MTDFAREAVADVLEEIKPLLEMHWREIAHYQDIDLNPDWDWYLKFPGVRVFTARRDGVLIGYAVFFVGPNRHYRQSIQAMQDILFLHPDYRGTTIGPRLVWYSDMQLKAEGVQAVYHHVKVAHDFGPLLKRFGYELVDAVWAKRLDRSE